MHEMDAQLGVMEILSKVHRIYIFIFFLLVRLTAWTTRILQQAQFQDWENLIYIEPRIISKAVEWLVKWQDPITGAFRETPDYENVPLDKKADSHVCFR